MPRLPLATSQPDGSRVSCSGVIQVRLPQYLKHYERNREDDRADEEPYDAECLHAPQQSVVFARSNHWLGGSVQQQLQTAERQTALLQQQNRASQYRFQQDYLERIRQQQVRIRSDRDHDYDHDPYFYSAPIYRYHRGHRYYETNQYGADLLRQAVNYGYEQGFRAGEADRQDRWHSN